MPPSKQAVCRGRGLPGLLGGPGGLRHGRVGHRTGRRNGAGSGRGDRTGSFSRQCRSSASGRTPDARLRGHQSQRPAGTLGNDPGTPPASGGRRPGDRPLQSAQQAPHPPTGRKRWTFFSPTVPAQHRWALQRPWARLTRSSKSPHWTVC